MSRRAVGGLQLWVEAGGAGSPTLLLCHGLSGTGEVWTGVRDIVKDRWPGRWLIPDMRGHGRSDHAPSYGIAMHAADMAALIAEAGPTIVAGHSMGGLVGITLATGWFGAEVKAVVTAGVKVNWSEDDIAQVRKVADTPARWFETRDEAIQRFLRVAGLSDIAAPESPLAASGIVEQDGRYRLAADMRTGLVALSDPKDIYTVATKQCKIALACGEHDRMASIAELRELDPEAVEFKGLGHNAHVEDPQPFWDLIAATAGI